jgi:hypothetical protein
MEKRLQAVYKDGVLQPLEPVLLEERQQDLAGYFTPEEWAEAGHGDISLDEVRRALSTISGSLSEAVIALRQER